MALTSRDRGTQGIGQGSCRRPGGRRAGPGRAKIHAVAPEFAMNLLARHVPQGLDGFLAWEEQQRERFELVGDVIRLMAAGSIVRRRVTD